MSVDLNTTSYEGALPSLAALTALTAYASGTMYFVQATNELYVWDPAETAPDLVPDGWTAAVGGWVLATGAGGGASPIEVVELSSTPAVGPAELNTYYEIDTAAGDVTLTFPPITGPGEIYVTNLGPNTVNVMQGGLLPFPVAAGEKYHFVADLPTNSWFVAMKEASAPGAIDDWFYGFWVDEPSMNLYLDLINLGTPNTIVLADYNVWYTAADGGAQATGYSTPAPIINQVQPALEITVTV